MYIQKIFYIRKAKLRISYRRSTLRLQTIYANIWKGGCRMNINYKLIGIRIGQLRREADMTQEELAALSEVTAQYISLVENGKKKVSLKVLAAISEGLDCSLDELVFGMANAGKYADDDWGSVISDCGRYEKEILLETVLALKKVLRRYQTIR